jgi:hypothetical protein
MPGNQVVTIRNTVVRRCQKKWVVAGLDWFGIELFDYPSDPVLTDPGLVCSVVSSGSPVGPLCAPLVIRDRCFVDQVFTNRQAQIRIGNPPEKSQKRFAKPLITPRRYRSLLDGDDTLNQARLAKQEGVSRARVTQILNLLDLDQGIQDYICGFDETDLRLKTLTERRLREMTRLSGNEQMRMFQTLGGSCRRI